MDRNLLLIIFFLCCTACAGSKKAVQGGSRGGDNRTEGVKLLNDSAFLLEKRSEDRSYGYERSNPVKVGGAKTSEGPLNERRFLNALLGPNGEPIDYFRAGSCCPFKTPNGLMNNTGLLDHYRVFWEGAKDTLDIYINMYDEGNLRVPVGLNPKS